ncbi:MAG: amidase [Gemmatimonadetes bacterium]|nr:amidase [Gemmatimonadota bacterium]
MSYDLRSVSLPKLGSTGLRWLTRAVEHPLIGPWLIEKLKRDAGVTRLRTAHVGEPPTFFPMHPAADPDIPPLDATVPDDSPYSDAASPQPVASGFRFPSVADYHRAYRRGQLTPEAVAESFLARWGESERHAKPLRAMIAVNRDDLALQARASATRWREGRPLGIWDGVPVAIKDELDVAGYPTTLGTRVYTGRVASTDSTVAARLRSAGALLVGKANMHELGINITGLNPHYGTPRNPYHDGFHTGGSSSGPACAVASGLVPVAIGADGGGSIRLPSAFCGLVGIKPTFGRISEHGVPPLVWSMAYLGPIAANVADCAAAYALIAGDDRRDPLSVGHPRVSVEASPPASVRGVRIGVHRAWFRHATAEVVRVGERMLATLEANGATVVELEIPELDLQRVAHIAIITGEMAASTTAVYDGRCREFALDSRVSLALARSFSSAELVTAARVRTRAMQAWAQAFRGVDVIATPASGRTAPPITEASLGEGESDLSMTTEVMRFAFPANLTGHPAISFPAGYGADGLPIGMQLIGRPWSESLLFRVATLAERFVERRAPARWYPVLDL